MLSTCSINRYLWTHTTRIVRLSRHHNKPGNSDGRLQNILLITIHLLHNGAFATPV